MDGTNTHRSSSYHNKQCISPGSPATPAGLNQGPRSNSTRGTLLDMQGSTVLYRTSHTCTGPHSDITSYRQLSTPRTPREIKTKHTVDAPSVTGTGRIQFPSPLLIPSSSHYDVRTGCLLLFLSIAVCCSGCRLESCFHPFRLSSCPTQHCLCSLTNLDHLHGLHIR